jgi:hypothetical protein
MSETREQLESSRARLAHENSSLRRQLKLRHEQLRRLESKVRRTIVVGSNVDFDELYQLRQMVPNKPRKRYGRGRGTGDD